MYKFFLLYFIFGVCSVQSLAQTISFKDTEPTHKIDSLDKWLKNHPQKDLARFINLVKYQRSITILEVLEGKTSKYFYEIQELAQKLNNQSAKAYYYYVKSDVLYKNNQIKEASNFTISSLAIFEKENDYSGQIQSLIALYRLSKGYYSKDSKNNLSETYLNKALKISKEHPNPFDSFIINILRAINALEKSNFDEVNEYQGNISKLFIYYPKNESLQASKKIAFWLELIIKYSMKVNQFKQVAKLQELVNLKELYDLAGINTVPLMFYFNNVADEYIKKGDYKNAIDVYKKAISKSNPKIWKDYDGLAYIYKRYRNIVLDYVKDYRLANSLADSVQKYENLHTSLLMMANQSALDLQYNYINIQQKALEDKQKQKLAEIEKDEIEYKLRFEKEQVKRIYLEFQKVLQQKELQAIKANNEKNLLITKTAKIKKNNNFLYFLILTSAFVLMLISYFYYNFYKSNNILRYYTNSREKLISIIANYLKTPVNNFQVYGDAMSFHLNQKNYVGIEQLSYQIKKSGMQMHNLLQNILYWGLRDRHIGSKHLERVNIVEVIEEVIRNYETIISEKKLELLLSLEDCENTRQLSKNIVSLVIRNLFDNAVRYSSDRKKIEVSYKKNQQFHVISIGNEIKLNPDLLKTIEELKQMFEKRERIEIDEKYNQLGLIIVNNFAIENNFTIEINQSKHNWIFFELILR